jgi:hypothetical protein
MLIATDKCKLAFDVAKIEVEAINRGNRVLRIGCIRKSRSLSTDWLDLILARSRHATSQLISQPNNSEMPNDALASGSSRTKGFLE